ncbi:YhcB family protein [Hoyosella sp. YIM 151337]|uniref:YhcB family protein n=1 Tax=Hoyosella sp. YIM 151337 TaxID=2992742 RepID=UPI00223612FC|nr:YhcB family protein [Hoyosella sp. YIM 151337]MCW4355323.1 YhcB family protein [Hoyosella sp. YIM 151337]
MIGLLVGVAAGYVLGTRAGRARYEQISRTARTVATSPATKKAIEIGRQKLADALSTTPKLERIADIDDTTSVYAPHESAQSQGHARNGAAR